MPDTHALLGPSSAHRWMACPPSARLEEGVEERGSEYAQEGTLAHRLGELRLRAIYEGADVTAELAEARADSMYNASMEEHIDDYVTFVGERMAEAKTRCADPRLFIEQRLELGAYIPESFGTSDVVIIADGLADVVDLKYGTGVRVEAEGNPQMRIYGLGAYLALGWAYQIDNIRMTIFQPRLDHVSAATMSKSDLLAWAETDLKPKAQQAWAGRGEFCPGEAQCRWCKISAVCRARADYQMELAAHDFAPPPTLDPGEIADVLARLPALLSWADQVKEYALDAAINKGEQFPGFKVVEGRSNRKYDDEAAISAALQGAGFAEDAIYKPRELLGITAMEKLVGKKKFAALAGAYITKPEGAPVLVPETDKRPALNTAAKAAEDFKED